MYSNDTVLIQQLRYFEGLAPEGIVYRTCARARDWALLAAATCHPSHKESSKIRVSHPSLVARTEAGSEFK